MWKAENLEGSCPGKDRLEAEEEPEARRMLRRDMRKKNGGDLLKSIVEILGYDDILKRYNALHSNC